MKYIFSLHVAVKLAFWMSHEEISSPLSAAINKMIQTESHDTTVEYVSGAH